MKRGRRVQKKEKTKQAILKAALELFAAKGFYATTTKAISKKAHIAERTSLGGALCLIALHT